MPLDQPNSRDLVKRQGGETGLGGAVRAFFYANPEDDHTTCLADQWTTTKDEAAGTPRRNRQDRPSALSG
jgi:hypothetical protein